MNHNKTLGRRQFLVKSSDALKGMVEQIDAVRHSGFFEGVKEAMAQADPLKRWIEEACSKGLFDFTSDLEKSKLSEEKDKKTSKDKKKKLPKKKK